jgi:hypothetical protein
LVVIPSNIKSEALVRIAGLMVQASFPPAFPLKAAKLVALEEHPPTVLVQRNTRAETATPSTAAHPSVAVVERQVQMATAKMVAASLTSAQVLGPTPVQVAAARMACLVPLVKKELALHQVQEAMVLRDQVVELHLVGMGLVAVAVAVVREIVGEVTAVMAEMELNTALPQLTAQVVEVGLLDIPSLVLLLEATEVYMEVVEVHVIMYRQAPSVPPARVLLV